MIYHSETLEVVLLTALPEEEEEVLYLQIYSTQARTHKSRKAK